MKNLIFRKFFLDTTSFFLGSLLIMGLIVWTIQAVNYFDFVSEDGHGIKVYFIYIILNFPKIISRILPFMFFISIFYITIKYEEKNELHIFWLSGISKIKFANNVIIFCFVIMFLQIYLSGYLVPNSQLLARNYIKNSNVNFFSNLINEGKFINIVKGLTIYIEKKDGNGNFENIFIEDTSNENSRMIFAKQGQFNNEKDLKNLKLFNGKIVDYKKTKINTFEFDNIILNLEKYDNKSISKPKIQEINSLNLFYCIISNRDQEDFSCENKIKKDVKQELFKRIFKPIYIPIIGIICCFLLMFSKNDPNYLKKRNIIFFVILIILLISETSLRYSAQSLLTLFTYISFPIIILFIGYYLLYKNFKHV